VTVYVDDMKAEYHPPHRKGLKYILCHMIADTEEELHTMAHKIGVARKWYQGDHYDITLSKKAVAIKLGAKEITQWELGRMVIAKRVGLP
jgi:hypothetical protein